MTRKRKTVETGGTVRPPSRLFLLSRLWPSQSLEELAAMLGAGDVASLMIVDEAEEAKSFAASTRPMIDIVQKCGTAVIVRGEARLARRLGADGVHVDGGREALREAIDSLSPELIVGAGNIASRHDAMQAGESGADYVFFGPLDDAGEVNIDMLTERASWWQELFVTPCVVRAPDLESVGVLARAGADFVALGPELWTSAGHVRQAQAAINEVFAQA